ncbi:MAG: helix-turn-helix domain-containing protein [Pseudonocardiaceae bacterium]
MTPAVRAACAARDIGAIFRFLRDSGMTQRELAALAQMNQSKIAAIVNSRQVQAYDVLARIADGLAIPRGLMAWAQVQMNPSQSGRLTKSGASEAVGHRGGHPVR